MALLRRPISRIIKLSRARPLPRLDFVAINREINESAAEARVLRIDEMRARGESEQLMVANSSVLPTHIRSKNKSTVELSIC
jgi:hypothetical protein